MAITPEFNSVDLIAEAEKKKALDMDYPDPYFDFRDYYSKGQEIYFAYVNEYIGEKEILKIKIRTIYARTMVGYEENACCHMIGYNTRDQLFNNKSEAENFLKTIKVKAKYD